MFVIVSDSACASQLGVQYCGDAVAWEHDLLEISKGEGSRQEVMPEI
jgi:hypothetical protein